MKKVFFILSIVIGIFSQAEAQTVALQHNGTTQIFKGIGGFAAAYNASNSGDTIYLSGHTFNAPASFTKTLTIYGTGYYTDSTLATGSTTLNGNIILSETADNFHIEGVIINGNLQTNNNESVNDLVVKRCYILGSIIFYGDMTNPCLNALFTGNVITSSFGFNNLTNALISNNIFSNLVISLSNGNIFKNNIFLRLCYVWYINFIENSNNNFFANNTFVIFDYLNNVCVGCDGNIFQNNLFNSNTPSLGTNANTNGNWTGVDPATLFINQTGVTYNPTHNYHLQTPSSYIGEDGTQVGIYGGLYPYKEGAVPINPHIQYKNLPNSVDVNGNLPVQIHVKAQKDQD